MLRNSSLSRKLNVAVLVVAAVSVVVGGCAAEAPPVPLGADGQPDAGLAQGREVYTRRCGACHGSSGGGGTGPKLSEGEVVVAYPQADEQLALIRDGRNGMPSFAGSLSDAELDAVVRYTREVLSDP